MSRTVLPGATRACPHCRTTVLDRSVRCPQCQKHLRFDPDAENPKPAAASPFRVEGTIRAPDGETWEYNVLVIVRDTNGHELSRQLVAVGALLPGDARTVSLAVEVMTARKKP